VWTALLDGKPLLPDESSALFVYLALRSLILCPQLRTVEDLPAWSVNVFNASTAEYSHILSVAGHSGDTGS
jgi:hypothetical protein